MEKEGAPRSPLDWLTGGAMLSGPASDHEAREGNVHQTLEKDEIQSEAQSSSMSDNGGINDDLEKTHRDHPLPASAQHDHDVEKQDQTSDPASPPPKDPNIVEFTGPSDPGNPKNWSVARRSAITVSMGLMTFVVTFSSSIFADAIGPVAGEFHIGTVTATLGVSLFLLGFVLGPVAFGPASEVWGRRIPLLSGYAVFAVFQIPVAVARNVETIMLGRFFAGLAASAPLAVVGGAMADMWEPVERAYAICAFAGGAFAGPVAGPIVGGFVTESDLGWRWTQWITLIMAALFGGIGLLVVPETSAARILQLRARELRYETGNWALHSKADEHRVTLQTIWTVYLARPWVMLIQEPILALLTAYMSYLYGVLYLLFEAFPISFHEDRGWSLGVSGLAFIGFIVGIVLGSGIMCYSSATNFKRAFIQHGQPIPEERLPPMILAAIVLPISLFWFGESPSSHETPTHLLTPRSVDVVAEHHVGAAGHVHRAHRHGVPGGLLAGHELHHRLLRLLRQQRHRGQHVPALDLRRRVPAVRPHVSPARGGVGDERAGVHLRGVCACAGAVLPVWGEDPGEVEVHADGVRGWDDGNEYRQNSGSVVLPRWINLPHEYG
ncbi:MFS transporter [Teratosphaeria destructans]|uniref:MFS transporter n=1 Tax=Teratosphaeria destructans TaxID=418781 RepID=A0A9W7SM61_9PEZI|nr:MFS transporter [Teratosphaeria destructans]